MKKLTHLYIAAFLALTLGLMLSCAKDEEHSDSSGSTRSYTVSGYVQKGPYVQGTEITVRELDNSLSPTGRTFTGTIDDNTGTFSAKGDLSSPYVELSADGYYFNEVSGSLSTAKLTLQALSDLTDSSSVNVNLMTHLEKKRVEYLMENSNMPGVTGMTFASAKTQAQTEIMKIFNIDNVTLGNSETLDISQSGDGNAVLLAISAILQSDKTEAELTELLSTINTDIRTDGTLDSTNTKATLETAVDYIKTKHSAIRSNIESRYSNLGISATIPDYESYAFNLSTTDFCILCSYVAVGRGRTILTSPDGITWTKITLGTSNTNIDFLGVTYGNDTFVTVGDNGTIKSSSDNGSSWTLRTSGTTSVLYGITYANSTFVTVGASGTILTSTDGVSWTSRTSGTSKVLWGVTYGNSTFVTVGADDTILTSSDGTSWTTRTTNSSKTFLDVTYGNNIFVAVGEPIYTSPDGITWTKRTSQNSWTGAGYGVTFGKDKFVQGGQSGLIKTSTDGINWTNSSSGATILHDGFTFGNMFIVVGSSGSIYTSFDGTNWTSRTSGTTNDLHGVTFQK